MFALTDARIECAGVIDARAAHRAQRIERERLVSRFTAARSSQAVSGRNQVRSVRVRLQRTGRRSRDLEADALLISGGYSPATSLSSSARRDASVERPDRGIRSESSARRGPGRRRGGRRIRPGGRGERCRPRGARDHGRPRSHGAHRRSSTCACPKIPKRRAIEAVWEVRGRGKAFVDLQNDVTANDVRLACREGYEHVEHMKRFTTHGMATDQGRIGGLVGSAVLAQSSRRARCLKSGSRSRARSNNPFPSRRWRAVRSGSISSPSAVCRCTTGTRPPARPSSIRASG